MEAWDAGARRLAKAFFGRPLRLELAEWILDRENEPFFQSEAQDAMRRLGEAHSAVATELRKFVDGGLLVPTRDGNKLWYTPTDSELWGVFRHVIDTIRSLARSQAAPNERTAR